MFDTTFSWPQYRFGIMIARARTQFNKFVKWIKDRSILEVWYHNPINRPLVSRDIAVIAGWADIRQRSSKTVARHHNVATLAKRSPTGILPTGKAVWIRFFSHKAAGRTRNTPGSWYVIRVHLISRLTFLIASRWICAKEPRIALRTCPVLVGHDVVRLVLFGRTSHLGHWWRNK